MKIFQASERGALIYMRRTVDGASMKAHRYRAPSRIPFDALLSPFSSI